MDLWAMVVEERESLIDTLADLRPEQWATPSLCGEWTVHEVLGHLVIAARPPLGRVAAATLRARGSFNKANSLLAREQASRPPSELLATYRGLVTKRFAPPGFGPEATLGDILVHSLDIRIPLDLPTERPAERYVPAIERSLSRRAQLLLGLGGRPKVRWVATDLPWAHGSGDEVRGTIVDLGLTASGRSARVDQLTGPGQPAVAAWLDGS